MKKIIFVIIILCGHFAVAQTPGFRYGAHFGIGKSYFSASQGIDQSGKLCLSAGGTASKQFTKHIALVGAALFTSKGSKFSGQTEESGVFGTKSYKYDETIQLFYAELPLLLKASAGADGFYFKVFAGPSFNFNLLGNQSRVYQDASYDSKNGFQNKAVDKIDVFELSGVLGAGVDIEAGKGIYYVDFRFNNGLSNWVDKSTNQYLQIGAGYMF